MEHPDDNDLAALAWGKLSPERRAELAAHLDGCRECRLVLSEIASDEAGRDDPSGLPKVGSRLGRYVVRKVLGSGGMGIVFECFDPDLDRRLAVKVLRRSSEAENASVAQEARTLARMAHPNVIAIYDVGTWNERVYLSMELAEGGTLRTWLGAQARSWREALELLRQTASGLSASHRAKITHGDVKPENVLLGLDGRPRLADFGLARSSTTPGASGGGGTNGYLAPELRVRPLPTEAGDQFAFCVMAAELLGGKRPGSASELALPRAVPAWIQTALRRGLEKDPGQRWPTIGALEDALKPPSRVWLGAAAAAVGVAALGGFAVWQSDPCHSGRPSAATITSAGEDGALLEKAKLNPSLTAVVRTLSRWRIDWDQTREQVCQGPRAERAVRLACLRQRFEEVEALSETISATDSQVRGGTDLALTSSVGQPPPHACLEDAALRTGWREASFDPVLGRTLTDDRARLALRRQVPTDAELELLRAKAAKGTAAIELNELWALAAQARGEAPEEAKRWEQALAADERQGDDVRAFDTAVQLARLEALELHSVERAETWVTQAQNKLERIGDSPLRRADLEAAQGRIEMVKDEDFKSLAHYQKAFELRRAALGDQHYLTLQAKSFLGLVYGRIGESERAFALLVEVVAQFKALFGEDTWLQRASLGNLAAIAADLERYDQEHDYAVRAREVKRASYGPNHPTEVAEELYEIEAQAGLGQCEQALKRVGAAEGWLTEKFPPSHLLRSWGVQCLGKIFLLCKDYPEASEHFETAAKLDEARGATNQVLDSKSFSAVVAWRANDKATAEKFAREVTGAKDKGNPSRLARAWAAFVLADLTWGADPKGAAKLALEARETLRPLKSAGPELETWLTTRGLVK